MRLLRAHGAGHAERITVFTEIDQAERQRLAERIERVCALNLHGVEAQAAQQHRDIGLFGATGDEKCSRRSDLCRHYFESGRHMPVPLESVSIRLSVPSGR